MAKGFPKGGPLAVSLGKGCCSVIGNHNGASENIIKKVLLERHPCINYTLVTKSLTFNLSKEEEVRGIFE